ncbi:hypothetical protein [Ensifer adhaerens]|uniref:hypothetical protein n=1 Tax=Ensifer adhaerens TaxID=106592 RepID=UPI00137925FE|nr:hypothetical protein [Ensifer adhaerens]
MTVVIEDLKSRAELNARRHRKPHRNAAFATISCLSRTPETAPRRRRLLKHPRARVDYLSHSSEEEKPDGKGQYPNQDVVERLSLDHGDDPHSPDRRHISIDANEG